MITKSIFNDRKMYLKTILDHLKDQYFLTTSNKNDFPRIQFGDDDDQKIINKVLFTLDPTLNSIHFALEKKINLILSYNGLIEKPIYRFNVNLVKKLALLTKYPISLFYIQDFFLTSQGGIIDNLIDLFYLELLEPLYLRNKEKVPYGRICKVNRYSMQSKEVTFLDLIKRISAKFNLNAIQIVGDLNQKITKVAIIGGSGNDFFEETLRKLLDKECNCLITTKINHKTANFAKEMDISVILLTNYQFAILSFKRLYKAMSLQFPRTSFYWYDSKDPFQILSLKE